MATIWQDFALPGNHVVCASTARLRYRTLGYLYSTARFFCSFTVEMWRRSVSCLWGARTTGSDGIRGFTFDRDSDLASVTLPGYPSENFLTGPLSYLQAEHARVVA